MCRIRSVEVDEQSASFALEDARLHRSNPPALPKKGGHLWMVADVFTLAAFYEKKSNGLLFSRRPHELGPRMGP